MIDQGNSDVGDADGDGAAAARRPAGVAEAAVPVDLTVLIPVLDEAVQLPATLESIQGQRFSGSLEFLFVDGGSRDGTPAMLAEVAREDPRIRMLANPRRRTPQALNIGLAQARGEFVARMDAHARYPSDYLERGVERLRRGGAEWVSGPQIPLGTGPWSRRIELALSSWLGTGSARFRSRVDDAGGEVETDTAWLGVWRRETLEALGGWDEDWPINQDTELAARVRKNGGRILCIADMEARYVPRESLRALARQYWRYGQYRAKTSRRHPESLRRSQLLPAGVALAVVGAPVAPRPLAWLARGGLLAYGVVLVGMSARVAGARGRDRALLPLVFAAMHLPWGFGFLAGSARFGPPLAAIHRVLSMRRAAS